MNRHRTHSSLLRRAAVACALGLVVAGCAASLYGQMVDSAPLVAQSKPKPTFGVRNWQQAPAIVEIGAKGDILAVGDVHGDYDRLVKLLNGAHVIANTPSHPANATWAAGNATLVFTGDLLDKGTQALDVIALIQTLQASAPAKGGQVILTMGNHEAEFLADPSVDKVSDFRDELKHADIPVQDVVTGRHPLGAYLRSLPFGAKVNDWFFCHAGNTAGKTVPQLTAELQKGIDSIGFGAPVLSDPDSLIEARLSPAPWWENGKEPPLTVLSRYTAALGVQHIVMGHQPGGVTFADGSERKKGDVYQKGGLIFLIDAGMSRGVDHSKGALLRISGPRHSDVTVVFPDGSTKPLWSR